MNQTIKASVKEAMARVQECIVAAGVSAMVDDWAVLVVALREHQEHLLLAMDVRRVELMKQFCSKTTGEDLVRLCALGTLEEMMQKSIARKEQIEVLKRDQNILAHKEAIKMLRNAGNNPAVRIAELEAPIPMLLFCPRCNFQHIDAPNPERNWDNPPHKSHECQRCMFIWRPCDRPTTGVLAIETKGKADTAPGQCWDVGNQLAVRREFVWIDYDEHGDI